jgi:hypothetical protein
MIEPIENNEQTLPKIRISLGGGLENISKQTIPIY